MTLVHSPLARTHPDAVKPVLANLEMAARAQREGRTVPIHPGDVLWLLESHARMLSVLKEMFCEGPIDVAFAGNPNAIAALDGRIRDAIDNACWGEG